MTILRRRAALAGVLLAGLSMGWPALPAQAQEPGCKGEDVIAKAKAEKPEQYAAFEAEARKIPNAEGLLWRIETKGAPASYLFGTMHSTEADLVDLAGPVREALGQARSVAVEIVRGDAADTQAKIVAYVSQNAIDTTGKGLDGLTEAQAAAVRKRLQASGLPAEIAPMLKPWFLGVTLSTSACELRQMASGKLTVDGTVEKIGREAGADVVGLETVEEQLGAISKIAPETARRMIRDAVSTETMSDDMQATTLALYRARRVGWYFATKADTFGEAFDLDAYKDFVEDIVDRRNRLMLERSKALIDKGSAFVAVGALHLPGRNGLVELLRGQGYAVTKVW
ncbi:TraB/GumN family protein [Chelatococcus sambhunathii]|uniref:TraB/GumN family protein n=1 Tax=Chelatococcus sambhunathii TaxID=363953 RepID=A0ABU1DBY8_9HYPH|nr:TraB/GumN family protein [Chelatococcus sambhunathii]MDR4305628.1 TraB/GumN family protein [Chelatococcus sambhunathii]